MTNQWDAFCQSQYDYCEFGTPIGLEDFTRDQIIIFPNPTNDIITIKSPEEVNIILYDLLGNIITKVNSFQIFIFTQIKIQPSRKPFKLIFWYTP